MINMDFKSVRELLKVFSDEQICIDHLEQLRWNGNVVSPFDATSKVYKCASNKYKCKNTGKYFNVKTATLFDNSKIELQTWFLAIYLVTGHKKGISSLQLGRDLNVTQKTAWFMLQRIRNCFGIENGSDLNNEVEIDETFVGGKNKFRHADKKIEGSQGRSIKDKSPVLGMIERGGKLVAKQVVDTKTNTMTPEIVKYVKDALVYTDEFLGYSSLKRIYDHQFVRHNTGQWEKKHNPNYKETQLSLVVKYVNGRIHTNTMAFS